MLRLRLDEARLRVARVQHLARVSERHTVPDVERERERLDLEELDRGVGGRSDRDRALDLHLVVRLEEWHRHNVKRYVLGRTCGEDVGRRVLRVARGLVSTGALLKQ